MLRTLAFCVVMLSFGLPAQAQSPQTPPLVTAGLAAYVASGHDSALAIWERGSPAAAQMGQQMRIGLGNVESYYGKAIGYDILGNVAIGSRVVRTYFVLHFERGPLYGWLDSYRTADGQVMVGILVDTKPQNIMPPAMLTPGVHLAP